MMRSGSVCCAALLTVVGYAAAQEYRYEIINLGNLPNTMVSEPADIANSGHVTGTSWQGGNYRAFLATPEGGLEDLGTLPAPFDWGSFGVAVNNKGQVTGVSYATGEGSALLSRAFRYTPGEGIIDLGSLGGGAAEPTAINDAGHVVGMSPREGEDSWRKHPFLWTGQEGMVELFPESDGTYDRAMDINNHGEVVGVVDGEGFLWSAQEGAVNLGDVSPAAINDNSVIAGDRKTDETDPSGGLITRAVAVYYSGELVVDVGTLPGFHHSFAIDINEAGHVLGVALNEVYESRFFIWTPETGAVDIAELIDPGDGWGIGSFFGINAGGQIVATASHPGLGMRAIIADPILPADLDFDADVDRADFALFQRCVGGSGVGTPLSCPTSVLADFDLDHDVDCYDYQMFLGSFTAPR